MKSKICGVSDLRTLNFIVNHNYPSQFIGFIVNYTKSKRYVDIKKLRELLKTKKKNSFYVAVLVNPNHNTLEEIKDLPFDYYQLYDCAPDQIRSKEKKQIEKVKNEIIKQLKGISRKSIARKSLINNGILLNVSSDKKIVDIINKIAPEHLEQ